MFVSQSGETADTLATLRYAKEQKQHVLSIVNVPTSTIARESDVVMPTLAGPEIGVASTKAFTCQLAALRVPRRSRPAAPAACLSEEDERKLVRALIEVPRHHGRGAAARAADRGAGARSRQSQATCSISAAAPAYPLALEGALKLKEISYIHAEGYAAGELKHGPIALIDETMPVIVIAPFDEPRGRVREDRVEHAGGRGARRQDHPDHRSEGRGRGQRDCRSSTLMLPDMAATVTPLVYAIPVQLIAYHTAVDMGTDVDQPRNLAKSVTVE